MSDPLPDPAVLDEVVRIRSLASGYWIAWAIQEAVHLNVVSSLADAPATDSELAERLCLEPTSTRLLLETLVANGLLTRSAAGVHAVPEATRLALVPGAALDQTGIIEHYRGDRWIAQDFEKAFQPGFKPPGGGYKLPESLDDRINAAHSTGLIQAKLLIPQLDLAGQRRVLDLGGGSGAYSLTMAEANPDLTATIVERGYMAEGARKKVAAQSLESRIQVIDGDFLEVDFGGRYSTALVSNIIHIVHEETSRALFARAFDALVSGGEIIVHDILKGPASSGTAETLGLALYFKFGCHTRSFEEVHDWLAAAGFDEFRDFQIPHGFTSVVIARKP